MLINLMNTYQGECRKPIGPMTDPYFTTTSCTKVNDIWLESIVCFSALSFIGIVKIVKGKRSEDLALGIALTSVGLLGVCLLSQNYSK